MFKKIILFGLMALGLVSVVEAQFQPQIPAYTVVGNSTSSQQSASPLTSTNISGTSAARQFTSQNSATYGTYNNAVDVSFVANGTHPAQVMGISTPSSIANYSSRDSVSLYADNTAPAVIANVAGTFTSTTFVPTTALSTNIVSQLKVGMYIDTSDSTKYTGQITSWATNGTSITVSGWFQMGNTTSGQIPSGPNAIINPITKIWAENIDTFLTTSSYATASTGIEFDLDDNSSTASTNVSWGFDAINLTSNLGQTAFVERGNWNYGFMATSYQVCGFCFLGAFYGNSNYEVGTAFLSRQLGGSAFAVSVNGTNTTFNVNSTNGTTDFGGQSSIQTPTLNFHSNGTSTVDSSIALTGGYGVTGGGSMTLNANNLIGVGSLTCLSANSACGNEAFRVTAVSSQTNAVRVTGSATNNPVIIQAGGGDSSISLQLSGKGTKGILLASPTVAYSVANIPTISACGSNFSVDSHANAISGTVTVGTGTITSCTATFATPYSNYIHCRVSSQSNEPSFAYSYSLSAIVVTGTNLASDNWDYQCDGN